MPNPAIHQPLTIEEYDELTMLGRRINFDDIVPEECFERYTMLEARRLRSMVYARLGGRLEAISHLPLVQDNQVAA